MHDKFKKHRRVNKADSRLRRQIAEEAARRMIDARRSSAGESATTDLLWLDAAGEADFHAAKRKAVAVLGRRVRPSDLPTDEEVRLRVVARAAGDDGDAEPDDGAAPVGDLASTLDRFTVYELRLRPLEAVKQNPARHPEGDALYHSLQVFERAKEAAPFDEEFLLAALLHDVGKGIDPQDHVRAGVEALRGSVSERTLWLVEHHMDLSSLPKYRRVPEGGAPEWRADLELLRETDDAGRTPGVPVGTVEEALAYLRALEREEFLDS